MGGALTVVAPRGNAQMARENTAWERVGPSQRREGRRPLGRRPSRALSGAVSLSSGSETELQAGGLSAGSPVYGQYWSRDPSHPDGTTIGLTGGLHFVVLP